MEILPVFVGLIVGGVVGFLLATLLSKSKSVPKPEFDALNARFLEQSAALSLSQSRESDFTKANDSLAAEKNTISEQLVCIREENAGLSVENRTMKNSLETQKTEIEELHKRSILEFENLANRILETKTKRFTETNQDNISKILQPLNEEIASFKKKVEDTYDKESKERFSLGERVGELIKQTDKVSNEANNLASALKGQAKTRGDWGEVILERVLEAAGFQRGREYKIQDSIRNEFGELLKPDVIIYLPEDRQVIVDSKISLVAYDRYCEVESDDERRVCLIEHIKSIRTHIDQLHEKRYDQLSSSLDFTLMFIAIEPAYMLAVQEDPELWARAYSKQIILITPTNLIAVIKVVSDLWNRERQSKNAQEIAEQGSRLYDKIITFVETMDDVGRHIFKTQEAFTKATNYLRTGRGNVIGQAEKLRKLGIASKKGLPASMSNFEEDIPEVVTQEDAGLLSNVDLVLNSEDPFL